MRWLVALLCLAGLPTLARAEPTDASADVEPPVATDPLDGLTWTLGLGVFADQAFLDGTGRKPTDLDLVYALAAEIPEFLTDWVGLGWRALLFHDLDGAFHEPLALTDTGTGREARIHGQLDALWLRLGPADIFSVTVGRQAVPGPGIADVRPVFDGATATLRLDDWLELSALGGLWTDVWELGGCPSCDEAWGAAARIAWLDGELAARALGYADETTGSVRLEQRLGRWRARSQVGLYGTQVYHADVGVEWSGPRPLRPPLSPQVTGGAGAGAGAEISARWQDITGVPGTLLGGSRMPEAIAEAVRSALPQRLFDAQAWWRTVTAAGLRVDAGLGLRVVDARRREDVATESWPWRDALRVMLGVSRGRRVEIGAGTTLYAALDDEVPREPDEVSAVALAVEGRLVGRPTDAVEIALRVHSGLHDQGAAAAPIALRGDHGGSLGAQWRVPVWGDSVFSLAGQWQVSSGGRAPFEAVDWLHGFELWLRLDGT